MPYKSNKDLPKGVRNSLPSAAQSVWRSAYNEAEKKGWSESRRAKWAWGAVKKAWVKKDGKWVKKQEVPMDLQPLTFEDWEAVPDAVKLSGYYALCDLDAAWAQNHDNDHVEADYVELAKWTTGFLDSLSNSSFAAVEPAYTHGETDNKRARHLPHHGSSVKSGSENASVEITPYRNARARINQITPVTDSITESALRRGASSHLKKHRGVLKADEKAKKKEREEREQGGVDQGQRLSAVMVGEIHLSGDGKQFDVPLIRAGTWQHPFYGEIVYDEERLQNFVDNFYADVVGHDLTLTLGHRGFFNPNPDNLGFVSDMILDDGYQLHLLVSPTEKGLAEVPHNLKYASAEVKPNFVDDETGDEYGPTIVGAAATNHPYITRQGPITMFSDDIESVSGPMVILVQSNQSREVDNMTEVLEDTGVVSTNEEGLETPPVVEVPAPPAVPDGYLELQAEVQRLKQHNVKLMLERHQINVQGVIKAAQDRGVVPAVLHVAQPILLACSEEAEATIKLSEDDAALNLFQSVKRLLEVIPSVTAQVTMPIEGQLLGDTKDLSPEEAEAKAKARMEELKIRSANTSTNAVEM